MYYQLTLLNAGGRIKSNLSNFIMQKKKLLVVTGAGSSLEFGMPSVGRVHEDFLRWAQSDFQLANDPGINLYSYLYEEVVRYQQTNVASYLRNQPNFEEILYIIYALAATYPAQAFTSGFGAFVARRNFPDILQAGRVRSVDSNALRWLASSLVDELLIDFRQRCVAEKTSPSGKFAAYQSLFETLQSEFEVSIATTNYDDLGRRALPTAETGFDTNGNGSFSPSRIFNRKEWSCLLHLHGSVHFDMRSDDKGLHTMYWQEDLEAQFEQNSSGRSGTLVKEGDAFPTSSIIAGYGKTAQIQGVPFRIMYSELDRLAHQADAVLFLGYGFGDSHVNNAFSLFRDSRNRPVVLIDFAEDHAMTANAGYDNESPAVNEALNLFQTHFHSMKWLGHTFAGTVGSLKAASNFERSDDPARRLSIWYGGMHAACLNANKVLAELR